MSEPTEAPATDDTAAPETGALTTESAIALLTAVPEDDAGEPAEAAEAAPEAEPDPDAPEAEIDPDAPPEAAAEPVNAPHFWDADAKALFAQVPPEIQAVIASQEEARNRGVERFVQANTEAANQFAATKQRLDAALETARKTEELIGQIDWQQLARDNPGEYLALREAEQQLTAAKAEADRLDLANFQATEGRKLPTIRPELTAPGELAKVYSYIAQHGVSQEQLPHAAAAELAIAHKAMLWDAAQAAAKTGKARAPAPAPRAPLKPSAAQPGSSPTRTAQARSERFARTGSAADAIELIKAGNL